MKEMNTMFTETYYHCEDCGVKSIKDDPEGCAYCEDTLCPACCVEQLDKDNIQ